MSVGVAPDVAARRRALLAYTAYVGQAQLVAHLPELLPQHTDEQATHLDDMLSTLLRSRRAHAA
ncbi:hypothetical protein [Dactylosporangium darangshiense]|uniref:hypothetical protein n=1 Tax=Dactylosporangium darangshiense TaxID=579108 RepID=UPI0031F13E5C